MELLLNTLVRDLAHGNAASALPGAGGSGTTGTGFVPGISPRSISPMAFWNSGTGGCVSLKNSLSRL